MIYSTYRLSTKEVLFSLTKYLLILFGVSFIFYDSKIAFFIGLPGFLFFIKHEKNKYKEQRRVKLVKQFCSMIDAVSMSLSAGLSVENAFYESEKDMEKLYGENSIIVYELSDMFQKISLNNSIEHCLDEFSNRTGIQEIKDFAIIFSYAKRSGGNFNEIIKKTVYMMNEKENTEKEIEVLLKGKMLEQKVMCLIPFLIMGYLRVSSREFISVLYHNFTGVAVMTVCLLLYIISFFISERISKIEV